MLGVFPFMGLKNIGFVFVVVLLTILTLGAHVKKEVVPRLIADGWVPVSLYRT
jgi:hypothetical protein